ncbi:MAG: glycine cleavage system protein GcvH [Clostridia bacterium]|nr:glycine cleavage system protein GcvH [Clostridia bacterium]
MKTKSDLLYSKDHEWVKVEEDLAIIGITDFAQNSLGDVVFVELPEVGSERTKGEVLGVVESVKAASEVYTPVSGRVVAVNHELEESPELLNEDPYGQWIAKLKLTCPDELETLMDEAAYQVFCAEEGN